MTKIFLDGGINKLGTWNYQMEDEDLSKITFYDNDGNEISNSFVSCSWNQFLSSFSNRFMNSYDIEIYIQDITFSQ